VACFTVANAQFEHMFGQMFGEEEVHMHQQGGEATVLILATGSGTEGTDHQPPCSLQVSSICPTKFLQNSRG
jgi:hypothetical protein